MKEDSGTVDITGFWAAWAPAVIMMVIIIALCSLPGPKLAKSPYPHWDKVLHFAVFIPLGWFLVRGAALRGRRRVLLFAIALSTSFAVLAEAYQLLIPGRSSEVFDAAANFLGALAGVRAGRRFY